MNSIIATTPMNTMKRAFGYVGMAIIGGLLSLSIHERFIADRTAAAALANISLPVKYVNRRTRPEGTCSRRISPMPPSAR
jgi:hypothetical protein